VAVATVDPPVGEDYRAHARAAAVRHGLNPDLFLRLVGRESNFNPSAINPKSGAIGLGQLMPGTASDLGVNPKDPIANLDGSARYLKQQLDRFGDYRRALAAYNAGPENVQEHGGVPPFPETQAYVANIMGLGEGRTVVDLGRAFKKKYPVYSDSARTANGLPLLSDARVGRGVRAKYPEYAGFADAPDSGAVAAPFTVATPPQEPARPIPSLSATPENLGPPGATPAETEHYAGLGGPQKAILQFAEAAHRALPSRETTVQSHIPPPSDLGEEAASLLGGLAGFSAVAIPVGAVTEGLGVGPLVAGAVGAGAAGAAAPGTKKERIARGGTMAVSSAALGAVTSRLGAAISKRVATEAPEIAAALKKEANDAMAAAVKSGVPPREAARAARAALDDRFLKAATTAMSKAKAIKEGTAAVGGAATFGVAQPLAERAALNAMGEKRPAPKPAEMVQSGLELLALNLILGGHVIARGALAPKLAEPAVKFTPEARAAVRENIKRPTTVPDHLRAVGEKAGLELAHALDQAQKAGPLRFEADNIKIEDAHIVTNLTRFFPGDPNPVRVTVVDRATGEMHSAMLKSISALRTAIGPRARELPAGLEKPAAQELPSPTVRPKTTLEGPIVSPEQFKEAVETGKARTAAEQERIRTGPAAIAALERQIAERPNDKNVNRWKRRLAKLKALPSPPPEPVAAEEPAPAERRGRYEDVHLADLVQRIRGATSNSEKKRLFAEISSRLVGVSPHTDAHPVDVTKASSWTSYLKEVRAKAKANPTDVAAQDEAFRAEQNFDAWKKREAAKARAPEQPVASIPASRPEPPTTREAGAPPQAVKGKGSVVVREPTPEEAVKMQPGETAAIGGHLVHKVTAESNRRIAERRGMGGGATSFGEERGPEAPERRVSRGRRAEDTAKVEAQMADYVDQGHRRLAEIRKAQKEGGLRALYERTTGHEPDPKLTLEQIKSELEREAQAIIKGAEQVGAAPAGFDATDYLPTQKIGIEEVNPETYKAPVSAETGPPPKAPRRELGKFERGDRVTIKSGYRKGDRGFVLKAHGPEGQVRYEVRMDNGMDAIVSPEDLRVRVGSQRATEAEMKKIESVGAPTMPRSYKKGEEPPERPAVEREVLEAVQRRAGFRSIDEITYKPSTFSSATRRWSNEKFVTDGHILFLTPDIEPKMRQRLHDASNVTNIEEAPKIDKILELASKSPVKLQPRGWTTIGHGEEDVAVFHDPKSGQIATVNPQLWKLAMKAVAPDSYEQTKGKPLSAVVLKRDGKFVGLMMPMRVEGEEISMRLGAKPKATVNESRVETAEARTGATRPQPGGMRPRAARGIPIARTTPRIPTEAEAATLPEAVVPTAPPQMKKGLLAASAEKAAQALHEIVAVTNPVRYAVGPSLDVLMRAKGSLKKALFRTERAQKAVREFWDYRSKGQVLDFWNRLESGQKATPKLAAIDATYRRRADNVFNAISRYKAIPYWENYFPHMWKNPKKAKAFFEGRRRPMEGTKAFLKKRVISDINAGLKAGLEPVSWNPEEIFQAWEHNARKYVNTQELLRDYLELGSMKLVRVGQAPPEGFRRLNQNWARLYLNPETEIAEFFDQKMMAGLEGVAKKIGVKLERKLNIGRVGRLGYSMTGRSKVVTKFATPESVLAHEIGHQIDDKFGLRDAFIRKSTPAEKKELRALADLRLGGNTQNVSPGHLAYIRSGPEKMAVMLEALIHAPQAFKEVAPLNYQKFIKFLASHDELAPLVHIRPSLEIGVGGAKVHAGGVVLGGEYWAEENLARLLDNHMSRDFISETTIGRGIMDSRNSLNAINLGLSAFHATGTTLLAMMSRMGVGFSDIAHGRILEGAGKIATTPIAPIIYVRDGWKFYRGAPELMAIEDAVFSGGASLETKQYYKNQMFDRFVRNARQALSDGTPYQRLGSAGKAMMQLPFVAIEGPMRFLTTAWIPQMKVGAFRDLYSSELRTKSADIAKGKTSETDVARIAWRDVEDRFGLINYDNEFWHNTLKSSIMVMIRAPGWTLGTTRALGGAAFADFPRFAARAVRGRAPEWTSRMSFALAMTFTTMALGALYHRLHTGKNPQTLEDYLHPQNGLRDENGRPMRVSFPTFMKDVEGWATDPIKTLVGRKELGGGASSLGHGGKLAPEVTLVLDLLENQSYRGPIRNVNDPYYKQAGQVIRYIFGREQPFSVAQMRRTIKEGGSIEQQAEGALGITRYYEKSQPHRRYRYREVEQ
jgi:Transglycosylase SLT domain